MDMLDVLKKIDPNDLDLYLDDLWNLSYEEAIELTHFYVKKEINKIPFTKEEQHLKIRYLKQNDEQKKVYLSKKRTHLFRTCTGSGKTVTSIIWAKYLSKLCEKIEGFVVLSAEYKHGTDEVEKIIIKHGTKVDYVYFKGKNKLCTQLETIINKKGTKIEDLMKNNISTKSFCDNECNDYGCCEYQGNCKTVIAPIEEGGIKNWIGVQHQMRAFLPIYMYHADGDIILIIDENFNDAIKEHFIYNSDILNKNLTFIDILLNEENNENEEFKEFLNELKKLLILLLEPLLNPSKELNYESIIDVLDDIDNKNNGYIELINHKAYELIKKSKLKPFKFIFSQLENFIDNYSEQIEKAKDGTGLEWLKSTFYRKNYKRKEDKQDNYQITFLYYDIYKLTTLFNRENLVKIIINDATADKISLNYIISEPIEEHYEDWMYENCEFHQLRKPSPSSNPYALYPKKSFLFKPTFDQLMNNLKAILKKHKDEPVLVLAREIDREDLKYVNEGYSLSTHIQTLGHPNVIFEQFPLKGTNEYSDVNVLVVLMKPELPPAVVKRQAISLGMNPKIYRMLYSRTEIIQGIGRIFRGNEHKTIYIFPAVDLPQFDKSKFTFYKSHTELRNYLNNEKPKSQKIVEYLEKNKTITSKQYAKIYGVSERYARDKLNLFVEKGILKVRTAERGKKIFHT
ncbi:MAG: hypothetical protein ACFFKA_14120 [Candidatus Thorarchaeota archaeon]